MLGLAQARIRIRDLESQLAERKAWLDDIAAALHGWPANARKTYSPDQLADIADT